MGEAREGGASKTLHPLKGCFRHVSSSKNSQILSMSVLRTEHRPVDPSSVVDGKRPAFFF